MKRIQLMKILAVVVCLAGVAGRSNADVLGAIEVNMGYAKTSEEFGFDANDAPGGGLAFGAGFWRSAAPKISWGIEGSYDNLGSVEYMYDVYGDGSVIVPATVSANVTRINPAVRVNLGAPIGPSVFLQSGAGYYKVTAKIESMGSEDSGSDGNFGFNLGGGVGFPLGPKTRMNFTGQYHSIATEGQSTSYTAFRGGISFGL